MWGWEGRKIPCNEKICAASSYGSVLLNFSFFREFSATTRSNNDAKRVEMEFPKTFLPKFLFQFHFSSILTNFNQLGNPLKKKNSTKKEKWRRKKKYMAKVFRRDIRTLNFYSVNTHTRFVRSVNARSFCDKDIFLLYGDLLSHFNFYF